MKQKVRLWLGKLFVQLHNYGEAYRKEQRQLHLQTVATIHPSVNVTVEASFINESGDPRNIVIGENAAVMCNFAILPSGGKIVIGPTTFIGPGTRIWSAVSIEIGRHVLIAHDVNILDNISHPLDILERREETKNTMPGMNLYRHGFNIKPRSVVIEDDVWIGYGASVMGGVRIGQGAVIGAGTMVTKDVPPMTVVVGNPMRIVRSLEDPT